MGTLGVVPQGDNSVELHISSIFGDNSPLYRQFRKSRAWSKEIPPPSLFLQVFHVYINMETDRTSEVKGGTALQLSDRAAWPRCC